MDPRSFAYQSRLLGTDQQSSRPRAHRPAASLDDVRRKWEERARVDDPKRHTLPAHIVASPLSPNSTGVSVENPDSPATASPTAHRIRLPDSSSHTPSPRSRRSNTLDASVNYAAARQALNSVSDSPPIPSSPTSRALLTPNASAPTLHRRPTSLYATPHYTTTPPDKLRHRASSSLDLADTLPPSPDRPPSRTSYSPSPAPSSVMSPTPYKSPHTPIKKASTYGQIGARRLGRHLPRIASGDGDDAPREHTSPPVVQSSPRTEKPIYHVRAHNEPPLSPDRVASGFAQSDDVAGVPGRLRLSRDTAPKDASPLPSSRVTRGLWADTQRHLLQAYEYLCHVGEAQQWIEGCLGEELGFGVVEMEEGLRTGVVLAKLVRAFQGERVVRRIYEVAFSPSLPSLLLTTFLVKVVQARFSTL